MENSKRKFNTKQTIITIISSLVILIASQLLSTLIGNLVVILGLPTAIANIITGILYASLTLLGSSLFCKIVLKITLSEIRICHFNIKIVWCIAAVIMPVLVSFVLICTGGSWTIISMDSADKWATITGAIFFYGVATGIVEETIFRGLIMSALEYRCNKYIAIIIPSVLFASLHVIGYSLNFISIVQLLIAGSLVGILFSLVTYHSGNIWNSAIIHGIWNMVMVGGILHIGTMVDQESIYNYVLDSKSFLISGGDFGVEASIVSTIVYFIFSIVAILLIHKDNNDKL